MSVSIGAVVLAAGMAVRMGRQKLLLPLDGKPMLTHKAGSGRQFPLQVGLLLLASRKRNWQTYVRHKAI